MNLIYHHHRKKFILIDRNKIPRILLFETTMILIIISLLQFSDSTDRRETRKTNERKFPVHASKREVATTATVAAVATVGTGAAAARTT